MLTAVLIGASPDIAESPVIPLTPGVSYNFITSGLFDTMFEIVEGEAIGILEQTGSTITGGSSFFLRAFRKGTEIPGTINVWIESGT